MYPTGPKFEKGSENIPKEKPAEKESDKKIKAYSKISDLPPGGGTITSKVEEWDEKEIAAKKSIKSSYSNVIKRLPSSVKDEIQAQSQLQKVQELAQKIPETPWDPASKVYTSTEHDYAALEALRKGTITNQQFGTLMMFKTELEKQTAVGKTPKVVQIFQGDGNPNPEAMELLGQGMFPGPAIQDAWNYRKQESLRDYQQPFLDQDQTFAFGKALEKMPKSEQQFLLVPEDYMQKDKTYTGSDKTWTVTMKINYELKLNVFGRVLVKDSKLGKYELFRVIPSVGLMQAFLDALAGEDSPILDPVLGPCTTEDFEQDAIDKTRKLGVSVRGAPQPAVADNNLSPGNDFTLHDFYHAFLIACMPKLHRLEMLRCAHLLDDIRDKKGIEELRERILDMENMVYCPLYRPLKPGTEELYDNDMAFWSSLALHCDLIRSKNTDLDLNEVIRRIVKHFAIDKKGKESGISEKGLLEMAEVIHSSGEEPIFEGDILLKMQAAYIKGIVA